MRESSFKLWGTTVINVSRFKQKYFKLSYTFENAAISDHFTADIQITHEINIELRGFLTIGKIHQGYPFWNSRWCFLQGFYLKYWNYPNEEYVSKPLANLDLRCCTTFEIRREAFICPNRKKIYLQFNDNTEYYLSPDSEEEFVQWESNLRSIYDILKREGMLII